MAGPLDGQIAVVTGGGRGIGKACSLELAKAGATVIINYTNDQASANATFMEIIKDGGQALVVRADVSDPEAAKSLIDSAIESYDKVDILVNNAGINRDRTIARMSVEEWDTVIKTDLSSMFYCTSAVVPGMRERNYGRIINISSIIGQMGNVGQANYAAAKAGVIAFTQTAAKELARNQITVNAVCPGFIETDMVASLSDEVKTAVLANIPLGRFGTADEVAAIVRFLCTEGGFFTGSQLSLNGGQHM
ncbi:MAG: beta-ketoacyl-ACP reductase [Chloroflexota bacterium]